MSEMNIEGSVAVVTGGASGLGEATARMLADGGGRVAILDRPQSEGKRVAEASGGIFCAADVTSGEQVAEAIAKTVETFGGLQIIVNCAGVGTAARTITKQGPMSLEIFKKTVEINLIGTFNVIRLAAARMSEGVPNADGERGVIVNTASAAAFDGQIGQAAYSASKGGVVGMTLPTARDLASLGIRCMTIAPGTFDTPMLALLPEEARRALAKDVPFPKRLGRPAEFAALACHIIENAMLNGETIRLDGAIRMPPK
jgi:NAD(P)-dependent dehydrogenase (short-subunit alcohol dehydrogenase family)